MLANNSQQVGIFQMPHGQGSQFASGNSHPVVGHKSPGAHDGKSNIRAGRGLQPAQRRVAFVGKESPVLAVLEPRKSTGKVQEVEGVDTDSTKSRCVDLHGDRHSFAGRLSLVGWGDSQTGGEKRLSPHRAAIRGHRNSTFGGPPLGENRDAGFILRVARLHAEAL